MIKIIIAIASSVSDHTAWKKSYLLYVNPIFLGLKTLTIQYRDIQSALDVFQKYHLCEDYTNLFWTQVFLLEFLETNLGGF